MNADAKRIWEYTIREKEPLLYPERITVSGWVSSSGSFTSRAAKIESFKYETDVIIPHEHLDDVILALQRVRLHLVGDVHDDR